MARLPLLHRMALRAERLVDRLFTRKTTARVVDPYIGYATPDHLVLRGRVLSALRRTEPDATHNWWINLRQMVSLFATDEVAGVAVSAKGVTTRSDAEGYFTLTLPRGATPPGWHDVPVTLEGFEDAALCPVLVPRPDARYLVISDIDDTMLDTGAYSLARNLWTSMTGNALTRRVFPDAVALMNQLSDEGRNPVFYVSSSPWNLHHFLDRIFHAAGLVRGPTFLRDLGVSETQLITGTHGDHKGRAIDTVLAAMPDLLVILMGDTGQHDAAVYRDAIARHPARIKAVILREPGPGPDTEARAAMEDIRATGTQLLHGPDFSGLAERLTLR